MSVKLMLWLVHKIAYHFMHYNGHARNSSILLANYVACTFSAFMTGFSIIKKNVCATHALKKLMDSC